MSKPFEKRGCVYQLKMKGESDDLEWLEEATHEFHPHHQPQHVLIEHKGQRSDTWFVYFRTPKTYDEAKALFSNINASVLPYRIPAAGENQDTMDIISALCAVSMLRTLQSEGRIDVKNCNKNVFQYNKSTAKQMSGHGGAGKKVKAVKDNDN